MSCQKEYKRIIASFCESDAGNIVKKVSQQENNNLRKKHLEERSKSEIEFFKKYCEETIDNSNTIFLNRGDINLDKNVNEIISLNPDLIISYGCSIIRSSLLKVFEGKFINIHLGLSPYYRGSGTNFWPFVEDELSAIGTTFMHIDSGIDTGDIIHQIRAKIKKNDSIHSIGNRLIKDSASECVKIIKNFNMLKKHKKIVLRVDYTEIKILMKSALKRHIIILIKKLKTIFLKKLLLIRNFQ